MNSLDTIVVDDSGILNAIPEEEKASEPPIATNENVEEPSVEPGPDESGDSERRPTEEKKHELSDEAFWALGKSVTMWISTAIAHICMLALVPFETSTVLSVYLVMELVTSLLSFKTKWVDRCVRWSVQLLGIVGLCYAIPAWGHSTQHSALIVYCLATVTFRLHFVIQIALIAGGVVVLFPFMLYCMWYAENHQRNQFGRAIRRLKTEIVGASTEITDVCAVCIDDISLGAEIRDLPCGHKFHKTCIDGWLAVHGTCPTCRRSILVQ